MNNISQRHDFNLKLIDHYKNYQNITLIMIIFG
jgi:hypothetical protein